MKNFKQEVTKWRCVDSHWVNIEREFTASDGTINKTLLNGTLADYMFIIGMDIPDYINYCLAEVSDVSMKFRKFGGTITIYLQPR